MFTGIVEELGALVGRAERPDAARFAIHGPLVSSDARPGDSIAVNGVCL
ncbi:MAG: riboflavin synthase, partial [Pseudonocardiaceae bacterium]